jgi:hypothetical protein
MVVRIQTEKRLHRPRQRDVVIEFHHLEFAQTSMAPAGAGPADLEQMVVRIQTEKKLHRPRQRDVVIEFHFVSPKPEWRLPAPAPLIWSKWWCSSKPKRSCFAHAKGMSLSNSILFHPNLNGACRRRPR